MTARSAANSRDLRVQRTYKLLKDALVRLLSQKTFDQITVQEICEEAMVRRTTFYQHFEDKHDFLNWFIREKQHEFTADTAGGVSPAKPQDYYAKVLSSLLSYLSANEQIVELLMKAGDQGRLLMSAFADACVEDAVEQLLAIPGAAEQLGGVPIPLLAEFYTGGVIGAAKWWFTEGQPCTEAEMADYIRRLIGKGE